MCCPLPNEAIASYTLPSRHTPPANTPTLKPTKNNKNLTENNKNKNKQNQQNKKYNTTAEFPTKIFSKVIHLHSQMRSAVREQGVPKKVSRQPKTPGRPTLQPTALRKLIRSNHQNLP